MHQSSYLNKRFTAHINRKRVHSIIECGSRDGLDALALYDYYHPSTMYVFECNPEAILLCRENLRVNPAISLVEKAVYNENKMVDFYPTDMEKSLDKNLGASSMLWHRDNENEFFQKKTQVPAIRLDTFLEKKGIGRVDLLCMDVQGVEIEVLEGLGDRLSSVCYIITEVVFEHYYKDDHLFNEVREFMKDHRFNFIIGSGLVGNRTTGLTNCLFENMKVL